MANEEREFSFSTQRIRVGEADLPFAEERSAVSTQTNAVVSNGTVEPDYTPLPDSTTIQRPAATGGTNATNRRGFWIDAKYGLTGLDVTTDGGSGGDSNPIETVAIYDSSDSLIAEKTGSFGPNTTISFTELSLQGGSEYAVVADGDFRAHAYNDSGQWPYETELFLIEDGFDENASGFKSSNNFWVFDELTAYS